MRARPMRGVEDSLKRKQAAFDVIEIDGDHVKATAFNMMFLVWCAHTREAAYRRGIRAATQLASRFKEGVGVCHYLEAEVIAPDAATRRSFVDFLRLPGLKHFSVIHEGVGFKAASVRAVVAGVHALGRPTCEHSVHKAIAEAAAWHAARQLALGRSESAAEIANTIRALRGLHKEQYPLQK